MLKNVKLKIILIVGLAVTFFLAFFAPFATGDSAPRASNGGPSDKPPAPATLPGNGLLQHDFFYAGEGKAQNMYIVRKGEIVWRYEDAKSKGEISDAVLLSNDTILFAHQRGVTLISLEKKVLWKYDAPAGTEIHTAQPIGKDHILFIQNGDPAKLLVINIVTGKTEREFVLSVANPKSSHGQFRHARLTDAGTLLVAHMDLEKVCEYDDMGKEIWSIAAPGVWSAIRLKNGNTLICAGKGKGDGPGRAVREVTAKGETVWQLTPADLPDYKVAEWQLAVRLPNGNTLINNWVNNKSHTIAPETAPVQAWEVTREKTVVWSLRQWDGPQALGPATTIQLLDVASTPEDVRFGDIR